MVLPDPVIDTLFLLLGNPMDGIAEYDEDMDCECPCPCDELGRWVSVAMAERYWITFFVLSVLPAPDSPLFDNLSVREQEWWRKSDERNEYTLVLPFVLHVYPCTFCDREYMGRIFIASFVAVLLYDSIGIKWQVLVRIDGD